MKIQNPYLRATLCLRLLAIALMLALSPSLFAQTNTTACTAAAIDCSSTPNLKSYSNPTTLPTGPTCAGANSPNFALWYTFTATQSSASLTITGGNFFDPTKTGIVLYKSTDGTCNNLSYVNCIPSTSSMTAFTNFSVTKGATYFVAVYSTTVYSKNATWTLCLTQPPANDEPVDALKASYVLTSGTSCTTQTFTLVNATASSGIPAGSEPTANSYYDVWFSFVANGPVETITLSNLGNSITSRAIELYSGSPGSLTPIAYASATTLTSTGLTVGTTYFIRVSNYGTAPITTNGSFDICVYYPKPSNDDCSGAKSISTSSTCSNTAGTLFAATPSTGLPVGCESTGTHYDVWYSFTAAGNTEVINLSSLGAGITNPEVQIYKGN
ncbi:MAG TPA: hypothetical protein VNS32_25255, partial [Flavisolibacter sp.]|nr:hypothetical protein [Flavisolibacter sp.]